MSFLGCSGLPYLSFPENYSIPNRGYRATVDLQDMQNEQEINADCGKSLGFEDSCYYSITLHPA